MTLAPYEFQEELVNYLAPQPNVLIGDDMGIGKTVEAILLDRKRRHGAPKPARTLVITPSSVVSSWEDHFQDWAPELSVIAIDRKNRQPFIDAAKQATHDVYIMHWDALRLIIDEIRSVRWLHVIGDECHKIKNRKAQVTVAANRLITRYKTAMSGTPADNAPQDLYAVLNWLYPNRWRSYWQFYSQHVLFKVHNVGPKTCDACLVDGEVKVHKTSFRQVIGVAEKEVLHQQMRPFFMRRRKEQVLKDLPEKYYSERTVELAPQQRRAYDEMKDRMLAWVGEHEDEPIAAPVVISQLVRLQQFGVAYGTLEPKEVKGDDGEVRVKHLLRLTEPSSKLDAIMDIVESTDEQIVVFSQSKQVIHLLGRRLEKARISYGLLTADTPQGSRGNLVKEFQRGRLRIFAGTISAGGIGITLTAASTCVFLDRAWSPSVNRQGEDRCHRIGQKNAVHIIDLIAKDTIDLGRLQRIDTKWEFLKELLGDPKEVKKKLQEGKIK